MALWSLTVGHSLAMLLIILPFALLVTLLEWQQQIQIGASLVIIGFGIFQLVFCPGNSLTKSGEFLEDGVGTGGPREGP
jgi:hypothetical protein